MANLRHTYSNPNDIASVHRDTNYDAYQLAGRSSPRGSVVPNSMLQTVNSKTGNMPGYQHYQHSNSNYTHSTSNPTIRQSSKGTHGSNVASGMLTSGEYNTGTTYLLSSIPRPNSPYDAPRSSFRSSEQTEIYNQLLRGSQLQNRPPSPSLRESKRRTKAQDDYGAPVGVTYVKGVSDVDSGPSSVPTDMSSYDKQVISDGDPTKRTGMTQKGGSQTARWVQPKISQLSTTSSRRARTTEPNNSRSSSTSVKRAVTATGASPLPNKAKVDTGTSKKTSNQIIRPSDSYKKAVRENVTSTNRVSVYDNISVNTDDSDTLQNGMVAGNVGIQSSFNRASKKKPSTVSFIVNNAFDRTHTGSVRGKDALETSNSNLSSLNQEDRASLGSRDRSFDGIEQFTAQQLNSDQYSTSSPKKAISSRTETAYRADHEYEKEERLDMYKREYAKLGLEIDAFKQENEQLKSELKERESQIRTLQATQETSDRQFTVFTEETMQRDLQIDQLKRQCKKLDENNKKLDEQNRNLEAENKEKAKRIENLTMRLSAQMQKEMSKDERNIESIADKYRPSVIIDNYTMLCSNEWLEVAEAIETYSRRSNADNPQNYEKLSHVFLVVNAAVHDHMKGKVEKVQKFLLSPLSTGNLESNGEIKEISSLILGLYRQNIDSYDTRQIVDEAMQVIDQKRLFTSIPRFASSNRFKKFVIALCDLCFKMELQRPAMSFSVQGARGKLDESIQDIQYGCRPQTPRPVVAFYTKPLLMHGDKIVAKGAVWLTDM